MRPPIFLVLTPPPPVPRGRWTPEGEGARRQTLSLQKQNLVWIRLRVAEISLTKPKCKNSPLTPTVTIMQVRPKWNSVLKICVFGPISRSFSEPIGVQDTTKAIRPKGVENDAPARHPHLHQNWFFFRTG